MKRLGVVAYAVLFAIVLPLLLVVWTMRLDALLSLPSIAHPSIGIALAVLGMAIIVVSVVDLRRFGRGWPMSPFPPPQRASRGMYRVMNDPIYVGSVILCAGIAIAFRSGAGIFLTTPLLALMCIAFVAGHERNATIARFGAAPPPFIHLPERSDLWPDLADRLSIYLIVLLPWWIAFEAVNALGRTHDVRSGWMSIDAAVPIIPWTELIYFLDYAFVLALPLFARTRTQLRRFAIQGWIATTIATIVYLAIPIVLVPKSVPDSIFATLMTFERRFNDPLTAFPAFHVIWAVIAAASFKKTWAWIIAAAISISCLTTGMHSIADVVAGAIVGIAVINAHRIARVVLRATEWLANSWREFDGGFIRAMTHGAYAAAGAFFGLIVAAMFAGGMTVYVVAVAVATIIGAALWAQWLEGSSHLLRPYGYYGGLIGACVAIAVSPDPWRMLAAYSIASTVVQAFGRCRCLVQGCCHGRIADAEIGIRYRHERSRVTRLSAIAAHPLHATQLYSIVANVVIFILLARLWIAGAPLQFIAGAAFVLTGLARFVEEHFRGEPQTRIVGGMRVYQWLAVASTIAGAAMMAAGNTPAPQAVAIDARAWGVALLVAVFTYAAYGVDFPRLNARFARLV